MTVAADRPPSIFLSHAHEDREFVVWLARYLTASGIRVWIDQAEIGVGDSLLEKIAKAIADMDYLGVVISPRSARSDWVTREVDIAMREDVAGETVKVLPILLRGGEAPANLKGKIFADFTSELFYTGSLAQIINRLGVRQSRLDLEPGRLSDDLASGNALLTTAIAELRGEGLSTTTSEALVFSEVADVRLSEFLQLIADEVLDNNLFDLALALVRLIDQRKVGQKALDSCLKPGRLDDPQKGFVAMQMQYVTSPDAVAWCHARLTSVIKNDPYYHSFLNRHIKIVSECCGDAMAAYLLFPNRGPGDYNVDAFELAISHLPDPRAFQRRWIEWVNQGYFGRWRQEDGRAGARILYVILNQHWADERFTPIVDAVQDHVYLLMKDRSSLSVREGLYHLVAMVDARYRGADRALNEILPRVYDLDPEARRLLDLLVEALNAVVAHNAAPSDGASDARVWDLWLAIAHADAGFTGYWRDS